jgi:mRNA-degrading endonuclease RelE of RelBE toxin-antitoxin system
MFIIEYKPEVSTGLKRLSAYQRRRILDTIEEQLAHEPSRKSRNRKPLVNLQPPWEQEGLVWELRVGEYRAFYEVDKAANWVVVPAIRHKWPHQKTEDIL